MIEKLFVGKYDKKLYQKQYLNYLDAVFYFSTICRSGNVFESLM